MVAAQRGRSILNPRLELHHTALERGPFVALKVPQTGGEEAKQNNGLVKERKQREEREKQLTRAQGQAGLLLQLCTDACLYRSKSHVTIAPICFSEPGVRRTFIPMRLRSSISGSEAQVRKVTTSLAI